MPVFNVSSFSNKAKPASTYGIIVDQLNILKNNLAKDGHLSGGDYQFLINKAKEIRSLYPLTPDQASNIDVLISDYEKEAALLKVKNFRDLDRLKRETEDGERQIKMLYANEPLTFLEASRDNLKAKLNNLAGIINSLEENGEDPTVYLNEYNASLSRFNNLNQALEDVKKNGLVSDQPRSDFIAYIDTNSRGEITDIDIGRIGEKKGYYPTNGIYGGMQIYGKVNRRELDKNIFILGNVRFEAPDIPGAVFDPNNPLANTSQILMAGGGPAAGGNFSYYPVDLTKINTQKAIYDDGWAEGSGGTFYRKNPNGKFDKYINASREDLGIKENEILKIPSALESNINFAVDKVHDAAMPPTIDISPHIQGLLNLYNKIAPSVITPLQDNKTQETSPISQRSVSPIYRAPREPLKIAADTITRTQPYFQTPIK